MAIEGTIGDVKDLDFEGYVKKYCNVTLEKANEFANKGRELSERVHKYSRATPNSNEELVKEASYLMWYLVKFCFDNKIPFGKGIIAFQGANDEITERFYNYFKHGRENVFTEDTVTDSKQRSHESLKKTKKSIVDKGATALGKIKATKDTNPTYSRTSSHFNAFMLLPKEGHFGIDSNKDTPLPLNFKTTAFGLLSGEKINDPDHKNSLYLKPETEGADIERKPGGTITHGANLVRTMVFGGQKIPGLGRYAENEEGYGDAIRVKFNGTSLELLNPPKAENKEDVQEDTTKEEDKQRKNRLKK